MKKQTVINEQLIRMTALLVIGLTLGHAGLDKAVSGEVPEWFLTKFNGSLLNLFDGALHIQFYIIAMVELLIAVLSSLLLFRKDLREKYFPTVFVVSALLFLGLSLGQRLVGAYDQSANLFFYSVFSLLMAKNL